MLFLAGAVVSPEERSPGKAREGNDRRSRGKTERAISHWRLWWRLVWGEMSRTAPSGYRGPPLALSISPSSETKDAQHFQAILCVHVSCAERVVQCDHFTVYNFFPQKKRTVFFFFCTHYLIHEPNSNIFMGIYILIGEKCIWDVFHIFHCCQTVS